VFLDPTKLNTDTSFLITPTLQTGQSVDIVVTIPQEITDGSGESVVLNHPYLINFNNVLNAETQTIDVSYTGTIPSAFVIGKFTVNAVVNATDTTNSTNTVSQNVPITLINDFCDDAENGTDLSISNVDINNLDGDDSEWQPLDEIRVRVEVSNDGNDRVRDVNVEIGLINEAGKDIIKDMDNLDNRKVDLGSISDGKDKTAEFTFNVPTDFEEENYKLIIKAYSADVGEDELCIAHSSDLDNDYYQEIKGIRETDEEKHIIVDKIILSPEISAQCGETVQLSGEVANIGDEDYEDQVKVTLFNSELGINLEEIIQENFDQGDTSSVSFDFNIPLDAAEKTYTLELRTYYDYDGDDSYDITSDKKFTKTIKVEGNCLTSPTTPSTVAPSISVDYDSSTPEAIAGEDVKLKATIRNNDAKDATYTISVSGNTAWSSLVSIDPKTVTVPAGQSRDVSIILNIDSATVGDQEFTIKATYGDNQVKSQDASLTVSKPSVALGSIGEHLSQNWFIYVIILVNLILIIAIIAVIVKMARPRRAG